MEKKEFQDAVYNALVDKVKREALPPMKCSDKQKKEILDNPCNMEDYKEKHIDDLYDWVMESKYNEAVSWSDGTGLHADDDCEQIIESYIYDNKEELWKEFFKTLKPYENTNN